MESASQEYDRYVYCVETEHGIAYGFCTISESMDIDEYLRQMFNLAGHKSVGKVDSIKVTGSHHAKGFLHCSELARR